MTFDHVKKADATPWSLCTHRHDNEPLAFNLIKLLVFQQLNHLHKRIGKTLHFRKNESAESVDVTVVDCRCRHNASRRVKMNSISESATDLISVLIFK